MGSVEGGGVPQAASGGPELELEGEESVYTYGRH